MKFVIWLQLSVLFFSCQSSHEKAQMEAKLEFEKAKDIFLKITIETDSVSVVNTDSTYFLAISPKVKDSTFLNKQLYGSFSINKNVLHLEDLNGDNIKDLIVPFFFSPLFSTNQLKYFKILLGSANQKYDELGDIFAGGECEGPHLNLKEIKKGVLIFSAREYAEADPCSSPSLKKEYTYRISNKKIIKDS